MLKLQVSGLVQFAKQSIPYEHNMWKVPLPLRKSAGFYFDFTKLFQSCVKTNPIPVQLEVLHAKS